MKHDRSKRTVYTIEKWKSRGKGKDEGENIDTHLPRTTEQKETLRFKRILCWDDDIMTIPSFIRVHE